MLALKSEALLHAILAIASLHIAKLQKTHVTASLKHYAIALRRIAKIVSIPGRREHPVVLATTLLLCFYECWCADHQKWSGHLLGVKSLVRDIDFAGMTAHIKAMRAQLRNEERARYREEQMRRGATFFEDRRKLPAFIEEIDENIVGVLMGSRLRYDECGGIIDDVAEKVESRIYSPSDLDSYELQRDLVWWYYKQDYIQSILGGGRLFLEYDRWSLCPPRAPLGRLDAVSYGTFDHLVLLIGRLADFSARDQKRKRLAMKANSTGGPTPPMPHFPGMIPNLKEPQPPMGFSPAYTISSESSENDDKDLEAQRLEAEDEWQEIRNAFSVLEDHFGEDFQPLGEEFSTPISTPFGTALQYRTYGVAGVWLNYYMGLIACHRAHPSMPPAAMAAAGLAARKTAYFANEIGRIAAGITGDLSMKTQVNPGVGAALIESSTCLFLAGVQYQKSEQRIWTVRRLKDIARLTGWESALAIAAGCETSWTKAAEFGKGPPYIKVEDEEEEDPTAQIWNSVRSLQKDHLGPFYRGEGQGEGMGSGGREDRERNMEGGVGMGERKERKLVLKTPERIHYALGVLGFQEDFGNLELVDEVGKEEKGGDMRRRGRGR
ncbi:hypothetical protein CJF30_00008298 [Rutstroemia sp. NJR-2017a BBW]|nr:hypothetical protein CJF30_00008298 [Rutstroemia sp. NJR-2017a BBW]